jgi:hypothetical protein
MRLLQAIIVVSALFAGAASAQDYPSRPVKIIVTLGKIEPR